MFVRENPDKTKKNKNKIKNITKTYQLKAKIQYFMANVVVEKIYGKVTSSMCKLYLTENHCLKKNIKHAQQMQACD